MYSEAETVIEVIVRPPKGDKTVVEISVRQPNTTAADTWRKKYADR